MRRSLKSKLEDAFDRLELDYGELEDVELVNKHCKECVKYGFDAKVLARYLEPANLWENMDWLIENKVRPDAILIYFWGELYNPSYRPIDLAEKLLQIGASKHRVFEMINMHLKKVADVPEKLIHDLSILMNNGVDRHRIMFWIEKNVSKTNIMKYADEFREFGVDPDFHEDDFRKEYGVELDAHEKELLEEYFQGASC